jgi:hypothetical protein
MDFEPLKKLAALARLESPAFYLKTIILLMKLQMDALETKFLIQPHLGPKHEYVAAIDSFNVKMTFLLSQLDSFQQDQTGQASQRFAVAFRRELEEN